MSFKAFQDGQEGALKEKAVLCSFLQVGLDDLTRVMSLPDGSATHDKEQIARVIHEDVL